MGDPEDDPAEVTEDELFMGLTRILAEGGAFAVPTFTAASRSELERRVHSLTFKRDQARALMLTALASRDITYVERGATFVARDAAIVDRDAHQSYAKEVVDQARSVLDHQDGTVRTMITLLECIDAVEQELKSAPQTTKTINYFAFLVCLTLDL